LALRTATTHATPKEVELPQAIYAQLKKLKLLTISLISNTKKPLKESKKKSVPYAKPGQALSWLAYSALLKELG